MIATRYTNNIALEHATGYIALMLKCLLFRTNVNTSNQNIRVHVKKRKKEGHA